MSEIRIRKPIFYTFLISILVLTAVSAFLFGVIVEREWTPTGVGGAAELSSANPANLDKLVEVENLIDQEYYGRPVDDQSAAVFWDGLQGDALAGLASGLDDYSTYLPPADQQEAANQLAGTFEGIGVWVAARDGKMTIIAPIPGSPAEDAGIRSGDVILRIDGTSIAGLSDADALAMLKGPAETTVALDMQRKDGSPFQVEVERRKIPVPVVTYSLDEEANLGIIRIVVFGDKTGDELDAALDAARTDGVDGIVLDLRNNGGGWVQSAQETIGRFVPADSGAALYEDFDPHVDGDEVEQPILGGDVHEFGLPLVVLVNNGTASAAEIVAGALRDYGRATIVGETTFGKGSVQRVHEFDDGSSFRLTFAHWLTPEKHAIDKVGIAPDYAIAATPGSERGDAQLDAAVKVLSRTAGTPVGATDVLASPVAQSATPDDRP